MGLARLNPRARKLVRLVEPNPMAACHLRAALERDQALEVAVSGLDLAASRSPATASLLIVDAEALPFPLPALLRTLRAAFQQIPILVIGNRPPDDELCGLLSRGVSGFVAYDKVPQEVSLAVEALLKGRVWFPPRVLERYATVSSAMGRRERRGKGALSPREAEVMGLLQRRLGNKEIDVLLGISERTVRFHMHNIFVKLGVHDRYSAIEWAKAAPRASKKEGLPWRNAKKRACSP